MLWVVEVLSKKETMKWRIFIVCPRSFQLLLWGVFKHPIDWTIHIPVKHRNDSFAAGDHLAPREWDYTQLVMTIGKLKKRKEKEKRKKKNSAPFGSTGISSIHRQSPERHDKWDQWVLVLKGNSGLWLWFIKKIEVSPRKSEQQLCESLQGFFLSLTDRCKGSFCLCLGVLQGLSHWACLFSLQ